MERAFGVDVLACPRCAGRLRLVATVEDPHAIRAILESLGLPAPASRPIRPEQTAGFLTGSSSSRRSLAPARRSSAPNHGNPLQARPDVALDSAIVRAVSGMVDGERW